MVVSVIDVKAIMGLEGVTSISDGVFNAHIKDARAKLIGNSDLTIKYYTAYLVAMTVNWHSLKKEGDVEFNTPKPETFKVLYEEELNNDIVNASSDGLGNFVSYDPKYDEENWKGS